MKMDSAVRRGRILLQPLTWLALMLVLSGCSHKLKPPEGEHIPQVLAVKSTTSFWKKSVRYAYRPHLSTFKDAQGTMWELAYQDVYWGEGNASKADTILLVHGRCANMGYFSQLTAALAAQGMRVIAVDLPNYGKSLPGNLDRPLERSLQSTREVVHQLLQYLQIQRFHLFGHSLGGQWAIGYALDYPASVTSLVLESPYGLEEYPTEVFTSSEAPVKLFDPSLAASQQAWAEVWNPLGHLETEMFRPEAEIRARHYFKKLNPETGALEESPIGLFLSMNQDSAFFTQAMVQSSVGNLTEYNRYITTCVRDIYAMGVETRLEDPASLTKRLALLRMPILMLFGAQDPFLPNTPLTGHQDLTNDLIRPAYIRLAAAGAQPLAVIYAKAAHVPHVDQPARVAKDLIRFVQDRKVESETLNPLTSIAP